MPPRGTTHRLGVRPPPGKTPSRRVAAHRCDTLAPGLAAAHRGPMGRPTPRLRAEVATAFAAKVAMPHPPQREAHSEPPLLFHHEGGTLRRRFRRGDHPSGRVDFHTSSGPAQNLLGRLRIDGSRRRRVSIVRAALPSASPWSETCEGARFGVLISFLGFRDPFRQDILDQPTQVRSWWP